MRGEGTTSSQIKEAPNGAIYVWVTANFGYVEDLARKLGRNDLKFTSPYSLKMTAIGTDRKIVIDHAAYLEDEDIFFVKNHNSKVTQ